MRRRVASAPSTTGTHHSHAATPTRSRTKRSTRRTVPHRSVARSRASSRTRAQAMTARNLRSSHRLLISTAGGATWTTAGPRHPTERSLQTHTWPSAEETRTPTPACTPARTVHRWNSKSCRPACFSECSSGQDGHRQCASVHPRRLDTGSRQKRTAQVKAGSLSASIPGTRCGGTPPTGRALWRRYAVPPPLSEGALEVQSSLTAKLGTLPTTRRLW